MAWPRASAAVAKASAVAGRLAAERGFGDEKREFHARLSGAKFTRLTSVCPPGEGTRELSRSVRLGGRGLLRALTGACHLITLVIAG